MPEVTLQMTGVNKSFGGVRVLKDVDFEVYKGEVHGLVGENGAGKSVLMKTLMGVHRPDSGKYIVAGKEVSFRSPAEAQRQHVSMVYQEFGLVEYLSVTENIFMGRLPSRRGIVRRGKAYEQATKLLKMLGSDVPPRALIADLKVADQQEVEIARALSYDPVVFVMDEPTSALSHDEIRDLFDLIRSLRDKGAAIIYISHKLDEVFEITDRVTIIRDGVIVSTDKTREIEPTTLMERMTGKKISAEVVREKALKKAKAEENILELRDFGAKGFFSDINLTVGKKEIVGIAGLLGAGKSELGKAIFGALPKTVPVTGKYIFEGKEVDFKTLTPAKAKKMGIGFVTEDRHSEGMIAEQSVSFNVTLPALNRVTRRFVVIGRRVLELVRGVIKEVALRPPEPGRLVKLLSGGNQQKVVLGKWLAAQAELLMLDEPTRGVDVGAREEIYDVITQLAKGGIGVLLLSSDLREIMRVSDRIVVMRHGRIITELLPHETSEGNLLALVLGEEAANKEKAANK
jgi:ribose transport system ATP-binding protein